MDKIILSFVSLIHLYSKKGKLENIEDLEN